MNADDNVVPVPSSRVVGHGLMDGGLTKREWLAGLAMQGLLAMHADKRMPFPNPKQVADDAVACADALIAELNKPKE